MTKENSWFLFGPRATGKSYSIRAQLTGKADYINLLDSKTYLKLKSQPDELSSLIKGDLVVIDEVQRVPELLNEVHLLIEEKNKRFLLTGSSARKLKRGAGNLLAGRAFKSELYPLTYFEIQKEQEFDLEKYLLTGGLPLAYLGNNSEEFLYSYVETYLKEEIQAEALTKNLANYTRFLKSAALTSGQVINYSKIASDAQLSASTVRDYYQILKDTLLGFEIEPWIQSKKRKAIQTGRFYLFDSGVKNTLLEISHLPRNSDVYGAAFEQFIANELKAYLSYKRIRKPLTFWRTTSQFEVDFIVGDEIAIEVKASNKTSNRDQKGLIAIGEEKDWQFRLLVSQDPQEAQFENGIIHLHWKTFLDRLWRDEYC
jgi:uncharacterized protein